jgi:hypothetical protein
MKIGPHLPSFLQPIQGAELLTTYPPFDGLTPVLPESIIATHIKMPKALTGTSSRFAGPPERAGIAESLPPYSVGNHPVAVSLKV